MKKHLMILVVAILVLAVPVGAVGADQQLTVADEMLHAYTNFYGTGNPACVVGEECTINRSEPTEVGRDEFKKDARREKPVGSVEPYYISTADELKDFRDRINAGELIDGELLADIHLDSSEAWIPIGRGDYAFEGSFVGNDHYITGLYVDTPLAYGGLFSRTDGAYIEGVIVAGYFASGVSTGGIVAYAENTHIIDCANEADIFSYDFPAGGIVGVAVGTTKIESCTNRGNVDIIPNNDAVQHAFHGGVAGYLNSLTEIDSCYNRAEVSGNAAGGIAGCNNGIIKNSYNVGFVSGYDDRPGSVVAYNQMPGEIYTSYYLSGAAPQAINVNIGTADVYYATDMDMRDEKFLNALNEVDEHGFGYYEEDTEYQNDGFPVLFWEYPKLTKYSITVTGGYATKMYAAPGEIVYIHAQRLDNQVLSHWTSSVAVALNPIADEYGAAFYMPNKSLDIAAHYRNPNDVYTLFHDLPANHWAAGYVYDLLKMNIVQGKDAGVFGPDDPLTRAQFVKMLAVASGDILISYEAGTFKDVVAADWFSPYAAWGNDRGIVEGDGEYFRPNDAISRQEMVVIALRYLNYKEANLPATTEPASFGDSADIAEWALQAVDIMQRSGIVSGYPDGNFYPYNATNRDAAAKVVSLLLTLMQ